MSHFKNKFGTVLNILEKVAFNMTSEASYVYILGRQKFIKNTKKLIQIRHFWSFLNTVYLLYLIVDFDMYYFLGISASGWPCSSTIIPSTIFGMHGNLTYFCSSISTCVSLVVWRFGSCVFQATETWKSHSKFTTKLLLQQDIGLLETSNTDITFASTKYIWQPILTLLLEMC